MRSLIFKKQSSKRRGAAAVEMAFVFPLFMLLVLGIVEFGRYMMVGQLLTNASREGARMAVSGNFTEAEITAEIQDIMLNSANIPAADLTVAITTENDTTIAAAAPKDLITVNVNVRFVDVSFLPMFDNAAPEGGEDHFSGLRATHDTSRRLVGISAMRKE